MLLKTNSIQTWFESTSTVYHGTDTQSRTEIQSRSKLNRFGHGSRTESGHGLDSTYATFPMASLKPL